MKILIEECNETQLLRVVPLQQFKDMTKEESDRVVIRAPNLCGGETRITIFKSETPEGNTDNLVRLEEQAENAPLLPMEWRRRAMEWITRDNIKNLSMYDGSIAGLRLILEALLRL